MPHQSPPITEDNVANLRTLGACLAEKRKALRVSATVAAEAAGISRVTLHLIEKGEPSVTMGAWSNAIAALGLQLHLQDKAAAQPVPTDRAGWWPARIALADYP